MNQFLPIREPHRPPNLQEKGTVADFVQQLYRQVLVNVDELCKIIKVDVDSELRAASTNEQVLVGGTWRLREDIAAEMVQRRIHAWLRAEPRKRGPQILQAFTGSPMMPLEQLRNIVVSTQISQ